MRVTENNIKDNPYVEVTLGSPKVMGYKTMGTGFLLTGKAEVLSEGEYFDQVNEKYSFANRVIVFSPESCKQMQ